MTTRVSELARQFPFVGSIAIAVYDLCYYNGSTSMYPASSQADQGTLELNQRLFARNFCGLSADARLATDGAVTNFPVSPDIEAKVECVSSAFNVGDLIGACENVAGNALLNNKVRKVTDRSLAIGEVTRYYGSATTSVWVRFYSTIAPGLHEPKGGVQTHTADKTVSAAETGMTFTTIGAAGTVVFSLPAATKGLKYRFFVGAAQELRIDPNGTETIALPSTGAQSAAGAYLTANAAGENVTVECVTDGQWEVFAYIGTWTAV
jgi:hypothetical protein